MYLTTSAKSRASSLKWWDTISTEDARRYQQQNEELLGRLNAVEAELARRMQQDVTIDGIRKLYGPVKDFPYELIPARVVAGDAMPYGQTRLLNTGAEKGTRVTTRVLLTDRSKALPIRLAAVTPTALVGEVVESSAFAARMRLVTDRGYSTTHALIRRVIDPKKSRQITVVEAASVQPLNAKNNAPIPVKAYGDGVSSVLVPRVKAYHNVQPGDLLVTMPDDPMLQAELRIGVVEEVQPDKDDPHFVTLKVRPSADLAALREVFLVVPLGEKLDEGGRH
jgi:cell shape-determining protein MreC